MEEEEEAPLRVNARFARDYEARKQREESLRARSLEDDEDDDDDDASPEDSDAEELTSDVERRVLETIRLIRSKDPRVYDPEFKPFDGPPPAATTDGGPARRAAPPKAAPPKAAPPKAAPLRYKDMVRRRASAAVQGEEEESEEGEGDGDEPKEPVEGGYLEANAEARREFARALDGAATEGEDDDAFFVARDAPPSAPRGLATAPPPAKESDEAFLWRYVADNSWRVTDAAAPPLRPVVGLDEDEDERELERAEEFEAAFNFRFEEPGAASVPSHPRVVEGSLRRRDDSRSLARARRAERKSAEVLAKQEELRRLRNLRRKLVEDEVARALAAGGVDPERAAGAFSAEDLDADFDPVAFDRKMAAVFDADFYAQEDPEAEALVVGEEEGVDGAPEETPGEDVVDDAQVDGAAVARRVRETVDRRVREEAPKVAPRVAADDPEPRFRYKRVPKADFGLTTDDILDADDAMLNSFGASLPPFSTAHARARARRPPVGLRRIAPYVEGEYQANPRASRRFRFELERRRAERAAARAGNKRLARRLKKLAPERPSRKSGERRGGGGDREATYDAP